MDFRLIYRRASGLSSVELDAVSDDCPPVPYVIDCVLASDRSYVKSREVSDLSDADQRDEESSSGSIPTPFSSKALIAGCIGVSVSSLADPPSDALSSLRVSHSLSVKSIQTIGLNNVSPDPLDIIVNTVRLPLCGLLDKSQNTHAAGPASGDCYDTVTVNSRSNLIQTDPSDYWFDGPEWGRNLLKSSFPTAYSSPTPSAEGAPRRKGSAQHHQTGSYVETDRQGTESSSLVGSASRLDESEDRNARTNELLEQLLAVIERMSADHRYKLPQTTRPY